MRKLLRSKPYRVVLNQSKSSSMRVNISPSSEIEPNENVYQVLRDDGILELVPEVYWETYCNNYEVCKATKKRVWEKIEKP